MGDGTRREQVLGADTRREGGGVPGGGTRREGSGGGWTRVNLPLELAERFSIVEELGSGGEGFVLLVRDADGVEFVVKLYHPNLDFDDKASLLLASANPEHVLSMVPGWTVDGSRFEVLEWCEPGTLRDLLNNGRRLEVDMVVAELAAALEHIHGLRLNDDLDARLVHQDLKPDNVMVRTLEPLNLVLGDFGLARMITGSRHYTNRQQGSRAWAPPSGEAISVGWDWWSFGMIVAEVAGGRHPFCIDGEWLSDAAISDHLSQSPVDLSDIDDDRVRTLCKGLLTRRTADRWGASEVQRWLAGETVAVAADTGGERRQRSVLFSGIEHTDPAELALTFQHFWDQAQERLIQRTDGGALSQQVGLFLAAAGLHDAGSLLKETDHPPIRLANLLAEMNPDLPPIYRGHDIRPAALADGLTNEATAAKYVQLIEDPKAGLAYVGVLTTWRHLEGMTDAPTIESRLQEARAFLLRQNATLCSFDGPTLDKAKAAAYAVAVQPKSAEATRRTLAALDTTAAEEQEWWKKLAEDENEYAPSVAIISEKRAREQTNHANKKAEEIQRAADRERNERERQAEQLQSQEEERKEELLREWRRERTARVAILFWVSLMLVWPAVLIGSVVVELLNGDQLLTNAGMGIPGVDWYQAFGRSTREIALTLIATALVLALWAVPWLDGDSPLTPLSVLFRSPVSLLVVFGRSFEVPSIARGMTRDELSIAQLKLGYLALIILWALVTVARKRRPSSSLRNRSIGLACVVLAVVVSPQAIRDRLKLGDAELSRLVHSYHPPNGEGGYLPPRVHSCDEGRGTRSSDTQTRWATVNTPGTGTCSTLIWWDHSRDKIRNVKTRKLDLEFAVVGTALVGSSADGGTEVVVQESTTPGTEFTLRLVPLDPDLEVVSRTIRSASDDQNRVSVVRDAIPGQDILITYRASPTTWKDELVGIPLAAFDSLNVDAWIAACPEELVYFLHSYRGGQLELVCENLTKPLGPERVHQFRVNPATGAIEGIVPG